jgi:hypothetical protein
LFGKGLFKVVRALDYHMGATLVVFLVQGNDGYFKLGGFYVQVHYGNMGKLFICSMGANLADLCIGPAFKVVYSFN